MQVVVGRLSHPTGARVLSMDAVCTALQVLRSAKQLASYNKASGTILKSILQGDGEGDAEASEEDQRAGAPLATPLGLPSVHSAHCRIERKPLGQCLLAVGSLVCCAVLWCMQPPRHLLRRHILQV